MFNLEAHIDQMLKITLELTDEGRETQPITDFMAEWAEATQAIRSSMLILQGVVPYFLQYQSSPEDLSSLCSEMNTPISVVQGYAKLLLIGWAGTLNNDLHDKIEELHTLAKELLVWIRPQNDHHTNEDVE